MAMALPLQHHLSLKLVLPPTPISSSFLCPYQVPSTTPRSSRKKTPNMGVQGPRLDNGPTVTKLELTGALPEYLWAEPRQRVKEFSPEDRRAAVESVLTFGTLLSAVDGIRFKLEPSNFNTIHRRFGELKKSQEVGLVKEPMKTLSIIMRKPCPQFTWSPALRAFRGLARCALNTSSRQQVLARSYKISSSSSRFYVTAAEVENRGPIFKEKKKMKEKFVSDIEAYSMVIAGPKLTGLPVMVYISVKYADDIPHIKVSQYYGEEVRMGEWFYCTIEEHPSTRGHYGNFNSHELVEDFIQLNRESLIQFWEQDEPYDAFDMLTSLKKV